MRSLGLAFALLSAPLLAQDYGQGCALRGTTPQLFSEDPAPGKPFSLAVALSDPTDLPLLTLGTSRKSWGPISLPLDLTPLGLRGCQLLAEPALVLPPSLVTSGYGLWNFPALPLPPGTRLYAQSVSFSQPSGSVQGLSQGRILTYRDQRPYRLVALPDTQFYSQYSQYYSQFTGQTQWIVNNRKQIDFVTHLGDIVQNGGVYQIEWSRAHKAMLPLDGVVPYNACLGNHDYDRVAVRSAANSYLFNFGPLRYQARNWYLGTSPDYRTQAQLVTQGVRPHLHFALEWHADDEDIAWAMTVMRKHPEVPVILSTHEFLGTGNPAAWRQQGSTPDAGGANGAEDIYRKLIEPFPQVFLVLCGHVSGTGRRSDRTALGQQVHQILSDYQREPNGGNGWLRSMKLDPGLSRIEVETLSPTYRVGVTQGTDHSQRSDSNFSLYFDFEAHARTLGYSTLHFREGHELGHGRYVGTQDTHIGDGAVGTHKASVSYGNAGALICDGNSDHEQILLRFDGIVGTKPGQIPPKAKVLRATLTVTTEGSNAQSQDGGSLYRLTRAWSESSTWNSLVGGIQFGTETVALPVVSSKGQVSGKGTRSFDVTRSVQSWADGASNFGWAIRANGNDAWSFRSSEWGALAERPLLTVVLAD